MDIAPSKCILTKGNVQFHQRLFSLDLFCFFIICLSAMHALFMGNLNVNFTGLCMDLWKYILKNELILGFLKDFMELAIMEVSREGIYGYNITYHLLYPLQYLHSGYLLPSMEKPNWENSQVQLESPSE